MATSAAAGDTHRSRGGVVPVVAAVALGGAVGACARVALGEVFEGAPSQIPWTTFWINVVGCGLLALLPLAGFVRRHRLLPPMLGTGLLGGFTTLSAWSAETHQLAAAGRPGAAAGYAMGTLLACLAVVAAVERLSSPADRSSVETAEGDL